ncbi:unnamed protein product [Effrenium voratum]|uniref:Prolyl 4-hydroxylase alpha subunit Fe(2+) 2OG dioxygenase domain-containing protein n=1 Tax=Effrenium voratum TaxID=2562239 RepID=A0AA36J8V9_9DINO|nr:unnamed protein product [Effrenium voratum]
MDARFYVDNYATFQEMGLDESALQFLTEGLLAHPKDAELRRLAQLRNVLEPGESGAKDADIAGLFATTIQTFAAVKNREVARTPAQAGKADPEMAGEDFWRELGTKDLRTLLLERGGLLRVSNFFPQEQADRCLATLQSVSWTESSSGLYEGHGDSAKHWFYRYDGELEVAARLRSLCPELFSSFQAARYDAGGNLAAHDDSNYFAIARTDRNTTARYPAGAVVFRKIALIYYLTKDWREDYGGALLDLHSSEAKCLVPRFNSAVAFLAGSATTKAILPKLSSDRCRGYPLASPGSVEKTVLGNARGRFEVWSGFAVDSLTKHVPNTRVARGQDHRARCATFPRALAVVRFLKCEG